MYYDLVPIPGHPTGREDLAPKHCAAAPLQVGAGSEPSRLRSPAPVSFLGRRNGTQSKMREGVALALGGRLSIKTHNNQITVSVDVGRGFEEGARPGRNVWGGRLPFAWGG
jgi:hypothetical protein